jgi:D-amino-acid oxidase
MMSIIEVRSREVKPELRFDICKRAHELNPLVPASPEDLTIIKDIVGFRPGRTSGLRVDSELIDGMRVVHAYGTLDTLHQGSNVNT